VADVIQASCLTNHKRPANRAFKLSREICMKLNSKVSYGAVAAAVAIACGTASTISASNIGATALTMSQQGNAAASASSLTPVTVAVTLGAGYVTNDTAKLSLTGGSFSTAGTAPADATCTNASATAVIGGLSYTGADANYRVITGTPASAMVCSFVVNLRTNQTTTGNATISYAAQIAGSTTTFDASLTTPNVIVTQDQFTSAVTQAANGIVDVNFGRYHFTADDTANGASGLSGRSDRIGFGITNGSQLNAVTPTSIVVRLVGNFSFLNDTASSTCSNAEITTGSGQAVATGAGGTPTFTIDSGCTTLTYTETSGFATGPRAIFLGRSNTAGSTTGTNDKAFVSPQSFTSSVTFNYGSASSEADSFTSTQTGSWSLNGASINVAFMQFSAETSRIINITNRSTTQDAAVTVSAVDETGRSCAAFSVGTVNRSTIKNISAEVDTGIRACWPGFVGRAALTVTANLPNDSVELYTGYNRNGSLSTIVNSSNGYRYTP